MKTTRQSILGAGMGLGASLVLVACTPSGMPAQAQAQPPATTTLAATGWQDITQQPGEPLTLVFAPDGAQVQGYAGCNRFFGQARLGQGKDLHLGPLASTRMACEPSRMALETRYITALESARSWRVEGQSLLLTDERGQVVWRLERKAD